MSRIGKLAIKVPKMINIYLEDHQITVKGPTGELVQKIPKEIHICLFQDIIQISKCEETLLARQKYGLIRTLINNMILGVEKKFEKRLQMVGVGYKAQIQDNKLKLIVGFSHPIIFQILQEIEIFVEANTNLVIRGTNKEIVGLFAAKIRAIRIPETYKGKGIKYNNEIICRKAGKSGKK